MKLLNLFFKQQEEQRVNENTLHLSHTTAKKKIDDFIKLTKPLTSKRRATFDNLMSFALDGEQWTNSEDKDLDGDMALTFNFSENYLDRYMARLFPRNPHTGVLEIGVKVFEPNQTVNEKYSKEVLDFYKEQNLFSVILEQGINYLCGGSAIFYYPADSITNKPLLISLNPKDCYLGWKGKDLVQFAYREYIGDNKYNIYYWDLAEYIFKDGKTEQSTKKANKYNFIPVSWIPNNPKPHSHEGRSKLLSLYNLDRAYNFAATDYARRIKDNTEPHLAIFSNDVSIADVDRGRKKKTKLAKDDDMKYLELKEGKDIKEYLDLLEQKIKSKAGIVDSSGAISAQVSGVSLSFQYSDMMDLIGFMRIAWDNAFRQINNAVLCYAFAEKGYKTDPLYHPFISIDNKQRVEEYVMMIENKIISHRDAIDELRGVESPDEKLKDIIAEDKEMNPEPKIDPKNKWEFGDNKKQ
ncbi:phage portal protein [Candidatus Parcubacteria bacterium]|nr:phage portal protein [Candidatus Parcubacteria bacterium]